MPLKILCPHCNQILLAEDETAGQRKLCPACGRPFDVPLPLSEEIPHTEVAVTCPRCGAEAAPGTTVCQQCFTNLVTGKRLPFLQRLRRIPIRIWATLVLGTALAGLIVYIGLYIALTRLVHPPKPASPLPTTLPAPSPAETWARRLLSADSPTAREAAAERLRLMAAHAQHEVATAIARALQEALEEAAPNMQDPHNRTAALDLLARTARHDPAALEKLAPILSACARRPALHEAVLRTRALLGDMSVREELDRRWLAQRRRLAFFQRLAELAVGPGREAAEWQVRRLRQEIRRLEDGLRGLMEQEESAVLDPLLEHYWDSRGWLGQTRGAAMLSALFDMAQPGSPEERSGDFEAQKKAIRAARDALERAGRRASPLGRSAAGLALAHGAPQYRSARQRIIAGMLAVFDSSPPEVQQQLAWTVARLTGRQFGLATADDPPEAFGGREMEAMFRWAKLSGLGHFPTRANLAEAYPQPIRLRYRVVTPARQLERDLLERFGQDWNAAEGALWTWLAADLGWTPRVEALLDPSVAAPHPPALAAALVLAAHEGPPALNGILDLWRTATDQPAWVRSLAYAVQGARDARGGTWSSGWPEDWALPKSEFLNGGRPGWLYFGAVLSAGGPAMEERLERLRPATLSEADLARLKRAARDVERLVERRAPE